MEGGADPPPRSVAQPPQASTSDAVSGRRKRSASWWRGIACWARGGRRSPSCFRAGRSSACEPLAREVRCKWAQRGGRISELQAYQHSLNLTASAVPPPRRRRKWRRRRDEVAFANRRCVRRRRCGGGSVRLSPSRSRERRGCAFEFDGAAAAAAVAAAAAAVVGRGGGGQTPEEDDDDDRPRAGQHRHGRRRGPLGSGGDGSSSPPPTRMRPSATVPPNRTATRQRSQRCSAGWRTEVLAPPPAPFLRWRRSGRRHRLRWTFDPRQR